MIPFKVSPHGVFFLLFWCIPMLIVLDTNPFSFSQKLCTSMQHNFRLSLYISCMFIIVLMFIGVAHFISSILFDTNGKIHCMYIVICGVKDLPKEHTTGTLWGINLSLASNLKGGYFYTCFFSKYFATIQISNQLGKSVEIPSKFIQRKPIYYSTSTIPSSSC